MKGFKNMNVHEKINYYEFPARDMPTTKKFFSDVFGWSFTDYGPEYSDVHEVGISVGIYKADLATTTEISGSIIVFFSDDLEATLKKIEEHGGLITRPIFEFPGGKRFHFTEPSGNEFGVATLE